MAEDPRRLAAQFEAVQRELQRVERQLTALESQLMETQQAVSTLRALGDAATDEVLVPIGAGVQMRAKATTGPVIAAIGAETAVEMPVEAALAMLEERVKAASVEFQRASSEAQQLANTAGMLNEKLTNAQG